MKMKLLFAFLALSSTLMSCGPPSGPDSSTPLSGAPATRQASPLPLGPTYASIFQNIITPKCLSCHSGTEISGNVDLSSYDLLVHSTFKPNLVVAGQADNSLFFQVVKSGQMPRNGTPLSLNELTAIQTWINDGAQNN
jgi:hypothetical protein